LTRIHKRFFGDLSTQLPKIFGIHDRGELEQIASVSALEHLEKVKKEGE
jgi:hypothetical protein